MSNKESIPAHRFEAEALVTTLLPGPFIWNHLFLPRFIHGPSQAICIQPVAFFFSINLDFQPERICSGNAMITSSCFLHTPRSGLYDTDTKSTSLPGRTVLLCRFGQVGLLRSSQEQIAPAGTLISISSIAGRITLFDITNFCC